MRDRQALSRQIVDRAIVSLWLELHNLSDDPADLTDADLAVWGALTRHPAIQRPLADAMANGQGAPHA